MQVLEVRRDVLVEAVGEMWAAFSPASGETHLLNNEAAAFLEVLSEAPRTLYDAAEVIAFESGQLLEAVLPLLDAAAAALEGLGMIRRVPPPGCVSQPVDIRPA
jgi:PqqD family protein of HPr-rel-A system